MKWGEWRRKLPELVGLVRATKKIPWPRGRDVRRWTELHAKGSSRKQAVHSEGSISFRDKLFTRLWLVFRTGKKTGGAAAGQYVCRYARRLAAFVCRSWQDRRRRFAVVAGILAVSILAVTYAMARPNAVVVEVEGRAIGVARTEAVVQEAVTELEKEMAAQGWVQPENYRRLTVRPVRASAEQVLAKELLKRRLREALAFNVQAVAIRVNGRPIVWVKDRATAERVVARALDAYVSSGNGKVLKVEVEEKIDYLSAQVKTSEVATPEEAVQLLREGVPQDKKYVVAAGDSLWSIARSQGMSVEELRAANPQIKGDFLQIGDELKLVKAEAPLHVVVTREVQRQEELPYPVQLRQDGSLYRGQEKVIQEGKPGLRTVTYRVVERNGLPVAMEELSREIVQEPVPKIVARGTKRIVVASRGGGSGELGWPIFGQITSGYGYRAREFHGGIDIAAPYGSPVRAAGGGTVIYTGRDGGYGRMVLIDHGDGLVTRYAHLSRIDVEPGQNVSRGEVIGAVGESGRATGPHLHFEVMVNGSTRNPLNYLR